MKKTLNSLNRELRVRRKWHSTTQQQVFSDPHRFIVLIAGRRWGKTRGSVNWLMGEATNADEIPVAWIAPIYKQTKIAFRYFRLLFRNSGLVESFNQSDLEIRLKRGGLIQFRSGDRAENIEGEGYKAVVLDESWRLLQNADLWNASIRPTLADYNGRALIISRGDFEDTFLHELYLRGINNDQNYKSYTFTSYENPLIPTSEFDLLKAETPTDIFNQQYNAIFLSGSNRAIPNIKENATGHFEDFYKPAHAPYIMGLDLGKKTDYTVITVGKRGTIVYFERFKDLSWPIQYEKIKAVAEKYHTKIYVDSTGLGDPVFDELRFMRLDVEPYHFTESSRKMLLELLILRMDQQQISYPVIDVMMKELKSMRWEIMPSGRVKLKVPDGDIHHDDTVISLGLCNWGMLGNVVQQVDVKEDIQIVGEMRESYNEGYLNEEM